jgi:kanamycin kinase
LASTPDIVRRISGDQDAVLIWENELGGLTYRIGERYLKFNPRSTGIDLERESVRLGWIAERHPAPRVLEFGSDETAEWLVTEALPGEHAVGDRWRVRSSEAIAAVAAGLRAIHQLPVDEFPAGWADQVWPVRQPAALGPRPPILDPVVVHGDACAPNTLITDDGVWAGNVDFGDLGVGDRWADLAVASMSLDWNYGEGHQEEFFDAYGIARDEERIAWYRALWDLES